MAGSAPVLDDLIILSVWLSVVVACLLAGREGRRPSFTVLGRAVIAVSTGLVGGFLGGMHNDGAGYIGGANFAGWKTLIERDPQHSLFLIHRRAGKSVPQPRDDPPVRRGAIEEAYSCHMARLPSSPGPRVAVGVALANAILLVYGLFRPDSLTFSIAFLVAPSIALLWTVERSPAQAERRLALRVTWGTVAGIAAVVVVNWLRT
jgi:hypothetical protein